MQLFLNTYQYLSYHKKLECIDAKKVHHQMKVYIENLANSVSSHTEKLFSSDTRQSMKRQIATERLSKIYIARCGYTWLDESKWPPRVADYPTTL